MTKPKPQKNLKMKRSASGPLKPACIVDLEDAWKDLKIYAEKAYKAGFNVWVAGGNFPFSTDELEEEEEFAEIVIKERPKQPELREFRLS